ncbi:MAG TPA: peptide chain release factor N(5)-glutamine methyltransferase [Acidimicrobiales bacterium]|nr:peptide chain release factor N(5)-glutamine methyltransferase [Acidimicrobiales bacterium]
MTDANAESVAVLIEGGLDPREARWLVEEFGPDTEALRDAALRRRNGEPLQYVIGHWPFRSLDLNVDERALIPRPETEELVSVALSELLRLEVGEPLLVDLGSGSGAIGLALLDELRTLGVAARLVAVDESTDALALAQENALKHELTQVTFVHSWWFDDVDASLQGEVDLIVANPPYVGSEEFAELDPVLLYEPKGAIVAPDGQGVTGFADLEIIITQAMTWLRPGGVLVCEHANTHRDAVLRAATSAGFSDVRDVDDLAGHPRVLVARR